jgi:hypothetical protein
MKPSSKKAGSGKKIRLATSFTGAAACAFAFAPAAVAGTAQPAVAGPGHQTGQPATGGLGYHAGQSATVGLGYQALQPTAAAGAAHQVGAKPFSLRDACGPSVEHWLHLALDQGGSICAGEKGQYTDHLLQSISRFCGGNNTGWFSGTSEAHHHSKVKVYFGHGTYYAWIKGQPFFLKEVDITGWGGNDRCGAAE